MKHFVSKKLACSLALCLSMSLSSFGQSQVIHLSKSKATLQSFIKEIESQTKMSVDFSQNTIDLNKKVDVNTKVPTLATLMNAILDGQLLTYKIVNRHIIIVKKEAKAGKQTSPKGKHTVKGKVLDSHGEPVIGATVMENGTKNGVVTDIDGNFTLQASTSSPVLNISYIGYEPQKIKMQEGQNAKTIQLKEDSQNLNEVVVVGYGTQKKSDLTGGVIAISEEKLNLVTTNNLMDRLAGQVPGLSITTGNATPGQDQSIRVRGVNSLSASNEPLIVLDGIPYSGSLGDINPDMVASMSVLKDASAAAIYGARGANGVILIQTKQGKVGKATVTYKGQVGFSEPERRLDMMNGKEYVKYLQDYFHLKNGLDYSELTPEKILGADEYANYQAGRETDWQDVIFRKGFTTNHELGISGGTESTTYIASLSHVLTKGVMENTGMHRTNVSLNVNQNLGKWLKIGVNMQATEKTLDGPGPSLESGLKLSPYSSVYDEEGYINFYPMTRNTLFSNPLSNIKADYDRKFRNIFLSSYANVDLPVKGLSFRTNFGYNYRSSFTGSYYGRNTLSGKTSNGSASISNRHYYDYTWENVLKYALEIGEHKFDATGLFSMQQTNNQYSAQSAESFMSDDYGYHNMNAGEKNISISSSLTETAMLSYMLRLNYSYKSRYLITLTGRQDGYSAFGTNNKYAFFPSVALAWNINSEKFMAGTSKWLDQLKLRLSYGSNGNQAISAYQTLDRLSAVKKYLFGDEATPVNGVYLPTNGVGNPNLKWETTNTFNAGLDYSFLNGRLLGSFDFYVSNTKDLLMSRSVPYMNGYRSIMDNIGSTRNIGLEFVLTSVNIRNKDFEWRTTFNLAWNKDEITKLADNATQDLTNKWFVGESSRVYYDYNVVGTWQTNEATWDATKKKYINADGKEIQKGAVPGSAKLEDVNGDGVIDSNDKKVIGSKLPSITSALTNNFAYKNVYASFVLTGLFGQWRQMHDYNFDRWMPEFNYLSGMNYWTEDNPTNEMTSPVYVPFNKHGFYKRMNYVHIKNVTLGYRLPKEWANSLGLQSIKCDLSVNNLYTFSNIKNALNFDSTQDDEKGAVIGYPTARSYMFTLNVSF